jgi:NTE family protein
MAVSPEFLFFLRKVPFLALVLEEDLKFFAEKMEPLSLPKGAFVFHAGEETDAMYLVVSGRVRLEEPGEGHRTTGFLGRGDVLGEMGILTGETRLQTAVVETTAEFLVLLRKDFDDIMTKAPHLAVPLSRFLSARLLEARGRPASDASLSRLHFLAGPAAPSDRLVLAVNMGVALAEQTGRRVLLLDVPEDDRCGLFARSLGLEPVRLNEHTVRREDLLNPEMIHRLCAEHTSGLSLLSLPRSLMEGKFAGIVYPFLATLRRSHDLILFVAPDFQSFSSRAVLEEADRVLLVEPGGPQPADAATAPPNRLWTVRLEPGPPRPTGPGVFRIPWRNEFVPGRSPLFPAQAQATRKAFNRLARRLGGFGFGMAMGSGAAPGYVLIGILKVLERHGLFPDVIAGTSMGALIGSFYASGKTPAEIEEVALSITKARMWGLADLALPFPRQGLIYGGRVLRLLKSVLGDKTFEDLEIPFSCVATDILSGEEVVMSNGRVAEAVRASLSLPFFFQPYYLDGRTLVDGGLVNPIPTSVVAAMGADVLVAVGITGKPAEKRLPGFRRKPQPPRGFWKGPNIFQVMLKTIYTMQYGIAQFRKEPAHIVLEPDISAFTWADFHRAADIIRVGEEYIEPLIPKIKSFFPFFAKPR